MVSVLRAPRGRYLLASTGLVVLALALLAGSVQAENAKIESVLAREQQQPWLGSLQRVFGKWGIAEGKGCEEQYGIMPCSTSLGGNAALLIIYGYMLLKAAQLLSDGSELLLTVMSPGIIGGLVLPILGAFPDALLITVSGLGATQAEAQDEVLVGMGLVAGSSVMVLTALWGSCLIVGRCDLVPHSSTGQLVAKDRTLTRGFNLTKTGVTNDKQTQWSSWIMIASLLPYLVAQTPRFFGLNPKWGHLFTAIAAAIAVLGLCGYIAYQLLAPWIQQRKIAFAQHKYRRSHAIHRASRFAEDKFGKLFNADGHPDERVLEQLFDHFDPNHDGHLSEVELKALIMGLGIQRSSKIPEADELKRWMSEFDMSNDEQISLREFIEGFKRWVQVSIESKKKSPAGSPPNEAHDWDQEAQTANLDLALLQDEEDDDEDEENEGKELSKKQVILYAICYLIAGAAVAAVFADPLVDAIGGFSKASGISPFFISFIATPLATNSSEAISSLIFARRKRKKNISLTYSQIYGAVTMNNTMCLGIFLAIVYFRSLLWDFSAEISVIFFATIIMGTVAAVRTTFPLWMAFIGLALYPLSIALVAFLDYVCGWH